MSFLACGINHKTAPLALREKLVFNPIDIARPLLELTDKTGIKEVAILSTCNRTEFYCASDQAHSVINWLIEHKQLSADAINPSFYIHQDKSAVQHILRVASGLDSMVLGEPQILGQLKKACLQAQEAGTLGKKLRHLFDYVFSVSKKVRTETAIGVHPVSVASAAIDLAKHIFADLSQTNVLCIGAGETIEIVTQYLKKLGVQRFWIANRTVSHAKKIAAQTGGMAIGLEGLSEVLAQADMIISATTSPLPIIGKGAVEKAIKIRKRRLMFMVDLAVPRDIEPEVSDLSDVYLYTLDDLQTIIQQNLQERQKAAQEAEIIIDDHANQYMRSLNLLETAPMIRAYREQAQEIRDKELQRALQLLSAGAMTPEQILEHLAHRLTNKLLHGPTQEMRYYETNNTNRDN